MCIYIIYLPLKLDKQIKKKLEIAIVPVFKFFFNDSA